MTTSLKPLPSPKVVCPTCGFHVWPARFKTRHAFCIQYRAGGWGFPLLRSYDLDTITDEDVGRILVPIYVKMKAFIVEVESIADSRGIDLAQLEEQVALEIDEYTARVEEALENGIPLNPPKLFIGPKRPRGRPRKHPKPDASQEVIKRPRGRPRKTPF